MGQPAKLAPTWSFAVPDWEERLREGRSLVPALPLDQEAVKKAVGIFNNLRLPDVPDQPSFGEAGGEWFRDIVRAGFGSVDPVTGERHVRKIFAMVPKKNSKTTGAAGIALTALLMNKRPNAELQLVGPTQEVADTAFDQAWGMIEADPEGYLPKRFLVRDHIKSIEDRVTGAALRIKTFDMRVTTGKKPVFVLLDELHVMASVSYATRVFGQIQGNMTANKESLFVIITTQSDQPPAGIFEAELDYARGVRDGRITERVRTLPVLYEFPEAVQTDESRPWKDPAMWHMVNPNLGRGITLERLIDEYQEAAEKGEAELRRWVSQHLNIQIGLGLHAKRWRGADYWLAATDKKLTFADLKSRCDVVVVGIDGGGLDDLFGLTVIGREKGSRRWLSWSKAWVQSDVLKTRPEIAERLRGFEKDEDLVIFDLVVADDDGEPVVRDFSDVADIVEDLSKAGLLPDEGAIGLDAAGVATLIDELVKRGITEKQLSGVPQGYRLMGAILAGERKLKDRTWRHADQALMTWCVGNAKAEQRGNAILITKETAGKAKIDPLMAAFNAVQLMSRNPEPARKPEFQMMFV